MRPEKRLDQNAIDKELTGCTLAGRKGHHFWNELNRPIWLEGDANHLEGFAPDPPGDCSPEWGLYKKALAHQ